MKTKKRWKRTFESFKVGQLYTRDFGKDGHLILKITKCSEHEDDYTYSIVILGSPEVLKYFQISAGSEYTIMPFEYPYLKLVRTKRK